MGAAFLTILLVVFIGFIAYSCIVITKNKHVSVIVTFGKFSAVKGAGLSLKLPWPIQAVDKVVPLNILQLSTVLELKTNDNLFIKYPINVQYHVLDAEKAAYELDDPETQIISYVSNLVRSEVGKKTFLELYSVRDEIQDVIEEVLSKKMEEFGFKIVAVLVDEPIPTSDVQDSYNSVTASEREKEAAKNRAEASRITIVAEAQAQKESKKLQGEGIADQRLAISRGFKESIESLSESLGVSNEIAVAMMLQLNKFDTLRDVANSKGSLIISDAGTNAELKELTTLVAGLRSTDLAHKH